MGEALGRSETLEVYHVKTHVWKQFSGEGVGIHDPPLQKARSR